MTTVKKPKLTKRQSALRVHMHAASCRATLLGQPRVARALRFLADPESERFKLHLMSLIRTRHLSSK